MSTDLGNDTPGLKSWLCHLTSHLISVILSVLKDSTTQKMDVLLIKQVDVCQVSNIPSTFTFLNWTFAFSLQSTGLVTWERSLRRHLMTQFPLLVRRFFPSNLSGLVAVKHWCWGFSPGDSAFIDLWRAQALVFFKLPHDVQCALTHTMPSHLLT